MSNPSMPPAYLQQSMIELAEGLYQTADRMAQHLQGAAQAIVHCLTHGGKVLCAGEGQGAWLAQQAAQGLLKGGTRARPPLAALAVTSAWGEQVRALGQPGDVWLAFSLERPEDEAQLAEATACARDMDLTLVVVSGEAAQVLGPMVRDTDAWVALPGQRPHLLLSTACLAIHGLVEAIDAHLLGEEF